ncbi:MAG TPA: hypothetical protein VH165_24570 [Kofleriaceae bacterium]|nr:hypothetical protein [Kofleriaceae bacterium]
MTKHTTHLITLLTALAIGALAPTTPAYAKGAKQPYALVPAGTAKFTPLDPRAPAGPQVAVISGDLKAGPVALLLKLPRGAEPIHWHTSDYYAVLVEGTAKHWLAGQVVPAQGSPAGTSWFQPGGSAATAHGDECTSDSCTVFVYMANGLDFTPVAPPASK